MFATTALSNKKARYTATPVAGAGAVIENVTVGRSSELKKLKIAEKVERGINLTTGNLTTDQPTDRLTNQLINKAVQSPDSDLSRIFNELLFSLQPYGCNMLRLIPFHWNEGSVLANTDIIWTRKKIKGRRKRKRKRRELRKKTRPDTRQP